MGKLCVFGGQYPEQEKTHCKKYYANCNLLFPTANLSITFSTSGTIRDESS